MYCFLWVVVFLLTDLNSCIIQFVSDLDAFCCLGLENNVYNIVVYSKSVNKFMESKVFKLSCINVLLIATYDIIFIFSYLIDKISCVSFTKKGL